jgi:peptide/nickel transport system permease protein
MGKPMEKQEAIDFITGELDKGRRPEQIAAALSRRLNAPFELVLKFVRRTQQSYEQSKAVPGVSGAVSPQPTAYSPPPAVHSAQPAASRPQQTADRSQPAVSRSQPAVSRSQPAARPAPGVASRKPLAASAKPVRSRKLRQPAWVKNVSIWLGAVIVGLFVLTALAAPLLAPPDPGGEFSTYKDIGQINRYIPLPPSAELILGSVPDPKNQRQLDVWYSLVWGTRSALRFGILVVLFTSTFGVILGGVSGYLGGLPNTLIMGFTDAFLALPIIAGVVFFQNYILMLLRGTGALVYWNSMVYFESPSAWQRFLYSLDPLLVAFIVFSWMPYARLMNSVVLRSRQEEYILASRSLGAGHLRLIFRHLLPNSISPAIVLAARDVGYLVLLQAGFTFIGLSRGSEWGALLSLGRSHVVGPGGNPFTWWWIYFPPTLAMVLFGVGWNLLGDGLNGWLNPQRG